MKNTQQQINNEEIWQAALGEVELNISKANFVTWFKNTSLAAKKDGAAIISVPNNFAKEWLKNKYNKFILKALRNISPDIKEVDYVIKQEDLPKKNEKKQTTPKQQTKEEQQLFFEDFKINKETGLNQKYGFENFVIGSSNELAHAAAISITKNPGTTYNPLFIYGNVGLGKTHLLQAIGNEIARQKAKLKIKYVSSEKFTDDMVNAIKSGTMAVFKENYRNLDVLLIDDIQFIAGKDKTQEEFFHVFNSLYGLNKQIVFSSDRTPKSIPLLEDRLRSRFEGGMIADISLPDFETRLAILKSKTEEKKAAINEDVLNYIAQNIQNNIREIEGALNRIIAEAVLKNEVVSLNKTKELLSGFIASKKTTTAKQVIKTVAEFYDLKEDDLIKKSRKKEIARPRQIIMYLLREELRASFPYIGEVVGGRDHTTALYSCEKISTDLKSNDALLQEINLIKQRLYTNPV